MMKRTFALLAASTAALATTASAQPLMTYTYADVAYQWTYFNESGIDNANGVDVQLSVSPVQHFALEGGYNYGATGFKSSDMFQTYSVDVTTNVFSYGGAGWYTIQDGLDIVARVGGIHARANYSGYGESEGVSDNGVYTGLTLRYLALKDLETDLNVTYDRINTGSWTYSGTVLYAVHENVALKGDAGINDNGDVGLLAGIRLSL
jgi:hypothetical protein